MSELKYLKRLIEVALPLKEVSEQSAREKSIRHGHICTLHIWWARRPLAACRAVVFASLIPDPDDPECPEHFRQLVRVELGDNQFKPKDSNGSTVEDTPRNRCLEFIKHLVRWENSNEPTYIEPAKKLIKEAHKIFHPNSDSDVPKVLDPFAGGGAIPLEALRLGCEAHAIELNPVAHLIELCTLVYPQKFGKPLPKDKPIPDYIKRLIAHNRAQGKDRSHATLFEKSAGPDETEIDNIIPDVEISEAEYRKNPLAADVKYWGYWILAHAKRELEQFYPPDKDGSIPIAFLWARTVRCPNPACSATIPLIRQFWLCKKSNRKVALRMTPNKGTKRCDFDIVEGREIDFDADQGTIRRGDATCPYCSTVAAVDYLRDQARADSMSEQPTAVVTVHTGRRGRQYRSVDEQDLHLYEQARESLADFLKSHSEFSLPTERIQKNARGQISPPIYGIDQWAKLFNARQSLALATFCSAIHRAHSTIQDLCGFKARARAITTYLGLALDRLSECDSSLCRWNPRAEKIQGTFGRQALAMVWDYCETSPFGGSVGSWDSIVGNQINGFSYSCFVTDVSPSSSRASADRVPFADSSLDYVITDPPYYDAVPYADLSDFFYVWQKRSIGHLYSDEFRTPLTPKSQEMIQAAQRHGGDRKRAAKVYEDMLGDAFSESRRVLRPSGFACVMFAHKTTSAWETLIAGLLRAGFLVSGSWPIHTEMKSRMVAMNTAALASSVTLVCRMRAANAGEGLWDDVRRELHEVAGKRLNFFWKQGIRGADFFISAIGPALSVFGKYEKVKRLTGEEVTVAQFLDEVRSLVTGYALNKIIKSSQTGTIDPETRFYVVWKWSYSDAKVPADEAFKLAQALGLDTEMMWDRTGTLEKSGQNVQTMSIAKRMSISNLGEPEADGSPDSMVDVLHRMCSEIKICGETRSILTRKFILIIHF